MTIPGLMGPAANSRRNAFDKNKILKITLDWAAVESPTYHTLGVNQMMDLAQESLEDLGTDIERLPGLDGYGDVVIGRLADAKGNTGHCKSGGGSDGNFTGALGLATLDGLGVGGLGAHTFGEHLLVFSLVPRTRLLAALLETLD